MMRDYVPRHVVVAHLTICLRKWDGIGCSPRSGNRWVDAQGAETATRDEIMTYGRRVEHFISAGSKRRQSRKMIATFIERDSRELPDPAA
jgi:hypothetical protein